MLQTYKQKADEFINKYRIQIAIFLIAFIVFGGTTLMIQGANAEKSASVIKSSDFVQQDQTKTADQVDKKSDEIVFDIEGAVVTPGVYRLPSSSVLIDAIGKAGGFSVDADRDRIARELNQASPIGNNAKLYIFKNSDKDIKVASSGSGTSASSSSSSSASSSPAATTKVSVNKATLAELDTLPGIGPALAQRIIDWRDVNGGFEVIEDLRKVKGIGDSVFSGLKDQIVVE